MATVGSEGLWKRRRSPRTTTGWRPKRRGGGATALRCAARAPAIPRRVGRRQHLKEALEQAWRRRGNVDDGHQRKHAACTRRCDLRRRRPASGARTGHPGVDGKWNTVHHGRYFIYRPGSRPPGPSDPLCAARISQYQVKADRHTQLPWPHLPLPDSDERRSSSSASSRTATRASSRASLGRASSLPAASAAGTARAASAGRERRAPGQNSVSSAAPPSLPIGLG